MTMQQFQNIGLGGSMDVSRSAIAGLLDALPNTKDPVAALEKLKTALCSLHPSALKDVVANTSFNLVFDFLNTSNRDQIVLCCDVLSRLLSVLDSHVLLHNFTSELNSGLHHPLPEVSRVCLKQISRIANENPVELCSHRQLLHDVIHTLATDNTDLSKLAKKTLVPLGSQRESLEAFFASSDLLGELKQVMLHSDIVRYRVYEVVIEMCKISSHALHHFVECGMLQQLVNEVYKDDLLVQLNALELIKELALCDHGFEFLNQQDVLQKLQEMLTSVGSNPMMGFLLPGLIKFFGAATQIQPTQVCDNYPLFLRTVFNEVSSEDLSLKSVAIETIGFVGKSCEGKQALHKHDNYMPTCIEALGLSLKHDASDVKAKTMSTVANLFYIEFCHQTEELLSLTKNWYQRLLPNPVEYFMSTIQQPFVELHLQALLVIKSLALLPWGQTELSNHPGFNEFLLNRSTERTKEGKELKYEIVKLLTESTTCSSIFGQPYFLRLKTYVKEGPFYVHSQSEVAFEGDT